MQVRYGRSFMGSTVAAYFDLDGTLLNASSEKTLTAYLARRRPWRIPWGTVAWTSGFLSNLLRGRAVYDAARNRGTSRWLRGTCSNALTHLLRNGSRRASLYKRGKNSLGTVSRATVSLVTATVAPMAEAMAEVLGMDAVYGCGPAERTGLLSGPNGVGAFPAGKEKFPSCRPMHQQRSIFHCVMAMATPCRLVVHGAVRPCHRRQSRAHFAVTPRRMDGTSSIGVLEFM